VMGDFIFNSGNLKLLSIIPVYLQFVHKYKLLISYTIIVIRLQRSVLCKCKFIDHKTSQN